MHIFLTGGTGFVGSNLLPQLLKQGHQVSALVRKGSESKLTTEHKHLNIIYGDIFESQTYFDALSHCDSIIHLIGIIREIPGQDITFEKLHVEATAKLVLAAREHNINRFIHMSALGADPNAPAKNHRTKAEAEQEVIQSGIDYTIFRPSIIAGPGDDFINYFADIIDTFHVIPIIGRGEYRLQPVMVDNIIEAFTKSLESEETIGNIYPMGGPEKISYKSLMQIIKACLNTWAFRVYIPKAVMSTAAILFQYFPFFPITKDQIAMLYEENVTDDKRIYDLLNITPLELRTYISSYLGA